MNRLDTRAPGPRRPGAFPWLLVALALAAAAAPRPARAALDADAVIVVGNGWRRVLPAQVAAARRAAQPGATATLPPVLLVSEGEERHVQALLSDLRPRRTVVVSGTADAVPALKLPGSVRRIAEDDARIDSALAAAAFPPGARARVVYLADGVDLEAALAAAALAASEQAPLLVADGDLVPAAIEAGQLARRLHATSVVLVGGGPQAALAEAAQIPLEVRSADAALSAFAAARKGARHLVVVAPADARGPFSPPRLSLAALPFVLARGAALAFAGEGSWGRRTPEEAAARLEAAGHGPYDHVTVVGDSLALPLVEVDDVDQVARGVKDARRHKLPAFVAPDGTPADRAVGRLATLDAYDLSRWVARLVHGGASREKGVLLLANADRKFILGEAISRATASELENVGVRVESYFRDEITPALIRRELAGHGLVLWEGHPRDLTLDDDALPAPEAALPPATFVLQGCYTLDRSDPYVLIERGASGVLGTYMAVYSASGSAFAKAWLDAQLYRGATAGEAMASARNFLLATVELKKRRGHDDWRKTQRAALSFDLWGDPSARLPVPAGPPRRAPVSARLSGHRLTLTVPREALPEARAGDYVATARPNAQLSALYFTDPERGAERRLVELFHAEVTLPPEVGDAPVVEGPYEARDFAWVFAPRTRRLTLVVHPYALGETRTGTLRFTVRSGGS